MDDYRDIALADAAIDYLERQTELEEALAEAVTYRWLYLELCRRFLSAEHRAADLERQIEALMQMGGPPE